MAEEATKQTVETDCPRCGRFKWVNIEAEIVRVTPSDALVWAKSTYRILECPACRTVFFQELDLCSEDTNHRRSDSGEWEEYLVERETRWPVPCKRDRPIWMNQFYWQHEEFYDLMSGMYVAVDNELRGLAAIAARTIFECTAAKLNVTADNFAKLLDELVLKGEVSNRERSLLATLADAGNAAAHRGWKPSVEELDTILAIVEGFVHRAWLLGDAAQKLKEDVPKRVKI